MDSPYRVMLKVLQLYDSLTQDLPSEFSSYVTVVLPNVLRMLRVCTEESIRSYVVKLMPSFLKSSATSGKYSVGRTWAMIRQPLIDAIKHDVDQVAVHGCESLSRCMHIMGQRFLCSDDLNAIINVLVYIYTKYNQNQAENAAAARQSLTQNGNVEVDNANNEFILVETIPVLSQLFDNYPDIIGDAVQAIRGPMTCFLAVGRPPEEPCLALCVFETVLEASVDVAESLLPDIGNFLLRCLDLTESPDIQQCAVYNVGIMATKRTNGFDELIERGVPRLVNMALRLKDTNSLMKRTVFENVVSAVAKILRHKPHLTDANRLRLLFVTWLPIYVEVDEFKATYDCLIEMIVSRSVRLNPLQFLLIVAPVFERWLSAVELTVEETFKKLAALAAPALDDPTIMFSCRILLTDEQIRALHCAVARL